MSNLLEQFLTLHTSPAICGIKASNLICIKDSDSITKEIEELNKKYPKIRFYILKRQNGKVLILVFRLSCLKKELSSKDNKCFLEELGYDTSSMEAMFKTLKSRMKNDDFPHEVGVFLGYDLSDIKSFINGMECKYVGYWKVYSNVEEKIKLFNRYNRCKEVVQKMVNRGYSLENFMR